MNFTIEQLIKEAKKNLPNLNVERVQQAYDFAAKAHEGQKRFSGEPYITHPLAATQILLSLHPDEDSIVACLLHDVPEDTPYTIDEIKKLFGPVVAKLVAGMEKLGKVRHRGEERQVENLRKMFLAMAEDLRTVLIKLCDRLHNVRTLKYVGKAAVNGEVSKPRLDKQARIANETLEIYVPIAARLGIHHLKSALEDACFANLHPVEYNKIRKQVETLGHKKEKALRQAELKLQKVLKAENIEAKTSSRIKHLYGIYRKIQEKKKSSIDDIFDIFALRVVLPDKINKDDFSHCYTTLGVIHRNWMPIPKRFKDYIALPKVNGYQSLHTTITGLLENPVEIQIRTETMHEEAEQGIAAHWEYSEKKSSKKTSFSKKLEWIQEMKKLHKEFENSKEFIDSLKIDAFKDRIFVFTPNGGVKDLPLGATPLDFAYKIHTSIGHRTQSAKVNGLIVPLDYQLKNEQSVEIILKKKEEPSRNWLSFVVTNHAKNKIRAFFNAQSKEKNIQEGVRLLNNYLRHWNKKTLDRKYSLLRNYDGTILHQEERENLLCRIGNGSIEPGVVLRKIFTEHELLGSQISYKKTPVKDAKETKFEPKISLLGEKNLPIFISDCCKPKENDEIIGYTGRGKMIRIHRVNCKLVEGFDKKRLISATWLYRIALKVWVTDQVGILGKTASEISQFGANVIDVSQSIDPKTNEGWIIFILEISQINQLEKIMKSIEKIEGVKSVNKVTID